MRAVTVRLVHGHIETGVAHNLVRAGEPAAVAELGPQSDGEQAADPVLALDQRSATGLTATEALQLGLQRSRLLRDGIDHPIARRDALPAGRAQREFVALEQLACRRPTQ